MPRSVKPLGRPGPVAGGLVAVILVLAFAASVVHAEWLGPTWSSSTAPAYQLLSCASDADLNYIYCVGGNDGTSYKNAVEFASPSASGTISKWNSTTVYPTPVVGQSCMMYQFYLYCVGGFDGSSRISIASYAQLSPTGVGNWQGTTSLPISVELQSCAAYSGYIYCVGGYDGSRYFNTTYYAKFSTSGGIGVWASTTKFPTPIASQSCVVSSGYIYCVGGTSNSATLTNATYYAPISSSGGVGVWSKTTSYPSQVYGQSCAVQSGFVYCVGGLTSAGYTGAVYYAPLSSSGVGSWVAATSYPYHVVYQSCVTLASYMYCVGGFDGSSTISFAYSDIFSLTTTTTVISTTTTTATTTVTSATYTVTPAITVTSTSVSIQTTTSTVTATTVSLITISRTTVVTTTTTSTSKTTTTAISTVTSTAPGITVTNTQGQTQGQTQAASAPLPVELGSVAAGLVLGVVLAVAAPRVMRLRGRQRGKPSPKERGKPPPDENDSTEGAEDET